MDTPVTPKRQATFPQPVQPLTQPATISKKQTDGILNHDKIVSTVSRTMRDTPELRFCGQEQTHSYPVLHTQQEQQALRFLPNNLLFQPSQERIHEQIQDQPKQIKLQQEEVEEQNNEPESEIRNWLVASTSREQRSQRFQCLLHSLWPSNEDFHGARNPMYDAEEEGITHEEFVKYRMWDGHCPVDDEDYDRAADPTWSTHIWQPQIGDDGIDNEEDLRIVLKMRQEHQARTEAFKKRRVRVIEAQLRAGIKLADVDMSQVLFGPDIESSGTEYEEEEEAEGRKEGVRDAAPEDETKGGYIAATSTSSSVPVPQPTISAKGIGVFQGQRSNNKRGRPRGSKNKKTGRKASKRKRDKHGDNAFKVDSDSEDEQPARKRGKGAVTTAGGVDNDNWKATTRSAAKRGDYGGMDGAYEGDDLHTDSITNTDSETTASSLSDSSDGVVGVGGPSVFSESDHSSGSEKKGFLSRLAAIIIR
ncbi:hypothetical protein F5Y19DRAFT_80800 [Xylariaceae sp. FL1651]|nr:hypothetical protein F5Y19DRAFT_80800 [Xylariaceae sp. FL1651]